jgi:hypothetical protein
MAGHPIGFETQVAQMLGQARTTPAPSELGTATQLGDPRRIASAAFPHAQSAAVQWWLLDRGVGGEYQPDANRVLVNSIYDLFEKHKQEKGAPAYAIAGERAELPGYVPAVLPHEIGHAVYYELLDRMLAFGKSEPERAKSREALGLVEEWTRLHNENLKHNRALGPYQYAGDPSHSFADAYGAWHVDAAKFKNLFPELAAYFEKISQVDKPEPQKK